MSSLTQHPWPVIPLAASETVLRASGLCRTFYRGTNVPVLQGVDLDIRRGEFVSIIGASGSGKSTLLHLLGTLDRPDSGTIHWCDERIDDRSNAFRDDFRNRVVGYVFQFYHLLPELSTLENVMLPALIRLSPFGYLRQGRSIRRRARDLLARVGLDHRLHHRPRQLSGGEMQRAAIARALLGDPELLLADEPTGNLDASTSESIVQLLCELTDETGLTVIMVTHDADIAAHADRTLRLVSGVLQ